MTNIGNGLILLGCVSIALSVFWGFAVLSAMVVELIPFDGPPRIAGLGMFGGIWLVILGGVVLAIDAFIERLF